jgi:hypothetical protein
MANLGVATDSQQGEPASEMVAAARRYEAADSCADIVRTL